MTTDSACMEEGHTLSVCPFFFARLVALDFSAERAQVFDGVVAFAAA